MTTLSQVGLSCYSVNELLSLTRLPIHFWNEVEDEPNFRDNPGIQLRSWIVAKCLDQEEVFLPLDISDVRARCAMFSFAPTRIVDWIEATLLKMETALLEMAAEKNVTNVSDVARRLKVTLREVNVIRSKIESPPANEDDDHTNIKTSLIDLRETIRDIEQRMKDLGIDAA